MGSKNSYLSELEIVKSILRETDSSKLCSTLILGFLGSSTELWALCPPYLLSKII